MASTIPRGPSLGSAAQWVIRSAAWWNDDRRVLDQVSHQCRSRMSPSISSTRPLRIASARFSGRPRTMLSTTTISPAPSRHQPVDDVATRRTGAAGDQNALVRRDSSACSPRHVTVASPMMRAGTPATLAKVRHVARDDGARADDAAAPERHARQDHGVRRRCRPSRRSDRRDHEVGRDDRQVGGLAGMGRTEQPGAGSPADMSPITRSRASRKACGPIHVPAPITQRPVEAALQHRLLADNDPVADLEGLRM